MRPPASFKALALIALLVAVALAGCAGGGGKQQKNNGRVDISDGGEASGEAGILNGSVTDDVGTPIAAYVTLDGTFHSTQAAADGTFRLSNVTAGRYTLRASHPDYISLQQVIDVAGGRITDIQVVMLPRESLSGDMRNHVHDQWGTQTRVTVMDSAFDWHEPTNDGPWETVWNTADQAEQPTYHPCLSSNGQPYSGNRHITFDEPGQLVWAGTKQIEVTMDWSSDAFSGTQLRLAWQSPNETKATASEPITKGSTYILPVRQVDWDSSHQSFSLWRLALCLPNDEENDGQLVNGDIHVKMDIVRMEGPIPAERPHPVLWPPENRIRVYQNESLRNNYIYQMVRNSDSSLMTVRPDGNLLIPPRTKTLEIHLEWTADQPTGVQSWTVTYRPANVRYTDMAHAADMLKPTSETKGTKSIDYVIDVLPEQTDQYYQQRSNWAFLLNEEGKEADEYYIGTCGCTWTFKMTIDAIRDPADIAAAT